MTVRLFAGRVLRHLQPHRSRDVVALTSRCLRRMTVIPCLQPRSCPVAHVQKAYKHCIYRSKGKGAADTELLVPSATAMRVRGWLQRAPRRARSRDTLHKAGDSIGLRPTPRPQRYPKPCHTSLVPRSRLVADAVVGGKQVPRPLLQVPLHFVLRLVALLVVHVHERPLHLVQRLHLITTSHILLILLQNHQTDAARLLKLDQKTFSSKALQTPTKMEFVRPRP